MKKLLILLSVVLFLSTSCSEFITWTWKLREGYLKRGVGKPLKKLSRTMKVKNRILSDIGYSICRGMTIPVPQ